MVQDNKKSLKSGMLNGCVIILKTGKKKESNLRRFLVLLKGRKLFFKDSLKSFGYLVVLSSK
jgi:hypothetical protein